MSKPPLDRLPPHSPEAEQGVIACCLLDPATCVPACMEVIRGPECFYDLRHQEIYEAIRDTRGYGLDIITLVEALKTRGELDQVGGFAYIAALPDMAPSSANLSYYLEILIQNHVLRNIIKTCTELVIAAYESEESEALIDRAEREILAIRGWKAKEIAPMRELVARALHSIERSMAAEGAVTGLPTGLRDLDLKTSGLHAGEMIVISGFPGGGKTSLAMNIAEHVCLNIGSPVGVFSLEMPSEQLVTKFICTHAKVNLHNIRTGKLSREDYVELTKSGLKLAHVAIHFDDTSAVSIYQLRARARRMAQQHGIKLLVIDYIQLMNAAGGGRRHENRQIEVQEISNGVKNLAKELNIPIVALSQLNDDGKLRDSRAIGQDADTVWDLETLKPQQGDAPFVARVRVKIQKARSGPTGHVDLLFFKSITRFKCIGMDEGEAQSEML